MLEPKSNVPISTLVFFDTETTGLPCRDGPENVFITELSFIAVSRRTFENSDAGIPRVANKLLLCIKPKASIAPKAREISGLNSDDLADHEEFTKPTAQIIANFLQLLKKPVCLLAHNGKDFDFPIFKAELVDADWSLPSDVLCADTLVYFKDILSEESAERQFNAPGASYSQASRQAYNNPPPSKKQKRLSYGLNNLYSSLIGGTESVQLHTAEGDCLALMKICHKYKDSFLHWVDKNATPFNNINAINRYT